MPLSTGPRLGPGGIVDLLGVGMGELVTPIGSEVVLFGAS
jgi:hypothetical protein